MKRKEKFSTALLEMLAEILLMLVCGATGYLLFSVFGMGERLAEENFELLVLAGLAVIGIGTAAALTVVRKIFGGSKSDMNKEKKRTAVILDTDVGADCDDMMAIAYLAEAEREGAIALKAITHSNTCEEGLPAIRAYLKHLGTDIEVGHVAGEVGAYDNYAAEVAEAFGDESCYAPSEDAVTLLRRTLSQSLDVILIAVGPMTNIAALLESKPDGISTQDGVALVRERCKRVVLMAGDFVSGKPEWNVKLDVAAMRTVVESCPVPLYVLPFECGHEMITGAHLLDAAYPENPLSLSFREFPGVTEKGGRHSWDPATAAFACLGEGELFSVSEPCVISVDEIGTTTARNDPRGMHRIISVRVNEGESEADAKRRVAEHIDACAMRLYPRAY